MFPFLRGEITIGISHPPGCRILRRKRFLLALSLVAVVTSATALPTSPAPPPKLPAGDFLAEAPDLETGQLWMLQQLSDAWKQGDWQQAYLYCKMIWGEFPQERFGVLCTSESGVAAGNFSESLGAFNELMRRGDPVVATAAFQHNLGHLLAELGRHQEAIDASRRALLIDETAETTWHNLASVQLDLKKLAEAVTSAEMALRLNPYYAEAWSTLGSAYLGLGQMGRAVAAFENSIRAEILDPAIPRADLWFPLADAYLRAGQLDMARHALFVMEKLGSARSGDLRAMINDFVTRKWIIRHED